jgi:hypothetical protein
MAAESTPPGRSDEAPDQAGGDYSYDLAHDAAPEPGESRAAEVAGPGRHEAKVRPWELEGDYSYDLAHEVPPAE